MTRMLQARYSDALDDFIEYRTKNSSGEHGAAALFRSEFVIWFRANYRSGIFIY